MKVSKSQASENRKAMLCAAARDLRGHGFDQMNVTKVAREARLTHGAFYNHFQSKEALQAEAIEYAFDECIEAFSGLAPVDFLHRYLSKQHRDNAQSGCPTAALVSEISRQSRDSQIAFSKGLSRFTALTRKTIGKSEEDGDEEILFFFAAMVGGLALARALYPTNKKKSAEVLHVVTKRLEQLIPEE